MESELRRKRREKKCNYVVSERCRGLSEINQIQIIERENNEADTLCEEINMSEDSESFTGGNVISEANLTVAKEFSEYGQEKSLTSELRNWTIECNVNRTSVTKLLHILRPMHIELPLSYKTLLGTPRQIPVTDVPPGNFIYLGLEKNLKSVLANCSSDISMLELMLNLDGAPLFENSQKIDCIWPLLCYVSNVKSDVFIVAIYCGKGKPLDFNDLLKDFVSEFNVLKDSFLFEGRKIRLHIKAFILDAPAKSAALGIAGHTGFYGCPKCYVVGQTVSNRTVFLSHECDKRSNFDFRSQIQPQHHRYDTVLTDIPELDLIQSFPFDYLHLSLLGIMKRHLYMFFGLKGMYADSNSKAHINELLARATQKQPSDFHRRLRSIEKYTLYKGTELRHFLFYLGPIVFYNVISKPQYRIFMYFHILMSILRDGELCFKFNFIAKMLVNKFLESFEEEYGRESITYNLHTLSHLPDDCLIFGKIDNFSAFCFENFIHTLKSYVKGDAHPLQEIFNRASEKLKISGIKCKSPHLTYLLSKPTGTGKYLKVKIEETTLEANGRDCYVQSICKNKIFWIENFEKVGDSIFCNCQEYTKFTDIYSLPLNSSDIYEYKVFTEFVKPCQISIKNVIRKFYVIDSDTIGISFFFPLTPFE